MKLATLRRSAAIAALVVSICSLSRAQTTDKVLLMNVQYANQETPLFNAGTVESAWAAAVDDWEDYTYQQRTLTYFVKTAHVPRTRSEYLALDNPMGVLFRDAIKSIPAATIAEFGFHAILHDLTSGNNGFPGQKMAYTAQSMPFGILIQEFVHSLNVAHSNGWDSPTIAGSGEVVPRGYRFCLMAAANFGTSTNFNPRVKQYVGWLGSSEILDVSQSGLHTIQASDSSTLSPSYPAALRIRGANNYNLWVEHRAQTLNEYTEEGALIFVGFNDWKYRNQVNLSDQQSLLLDMTPGSITEPPIQDFDDAPLQLGESWTAPNGVTIEVDSVSTGSPPTMTLDITLPSGFVSTIDEPNVVTLTAPTGTTSELSASSPYTFTATASDPDATGGGNGIQKVSFEFYNFSGLEPPFKTYEDTTAPYTCTVDFTDPTEWDTAQQDQGYIVVVRAKSDAAAGGHWNERGTCFMVDY